MSVYLSAYLSVYKFIHFAKISICLSIYLSLAVYQSVCVCVYLISSAMIKGKVNKSASEL